MPRNRMVKSDFFNDEKIGKLSVTARLLFIGIWIHSDDSGVCRANPVFLRNNIFPYDDMNLTDISNAVSELSVSNLVVLTEHSGESYMSVFNFLKHQTINRPSKFRYIENRVTVIDGSVSDHVPLNDDSLTKVKEKEKGKVKDKEKERQEKISSLKSLNKNNQERTKDPMTRKEGLSFEQRTLNVIWDTWKPSLRGIRFEYEEAFHSILIPLGGSKLGCALHSLIECFYEYCAGKEVGDGKIMKLTKWVNQAFNYLPNKNGFKTLEEALIKCEKDLEKEN